MVRKALIALSLICTATAAWADWSYSETKDAMTDRRFARSFVAGEGGRIGVKCDEPGADSLYIHFISAKYLGGSGGSSASRQLLYRFDDEPPVSASWSYDGKSAILVNDDKVWQFLRHLRSAKKLAVRAYDFEGAEVNASFDVVGADKEIAKVAEACAARER